MLKKSGKVINADFAKISRITACETVVNKYLPNCI